MSAFWSVNNIYEQMYIQGYSTKLHKKIQFLKDLFVKHKIVTQFIFN